MDAAASALAHRVVPWLGRWPLPAAATWIFAWGVFAAVRPALGTASAAVLAGAAALVVAWREPRPWRRAIVALGFPVSALASGAAAGWPAWVWLLPPALLLLAYPRRAWGDAPLFPTPAGALDALAARIALPAGARVLDAGCGLGDGLRALHRAWPQAQVEGVELSPALAWLARRRCPWARVDRADMWARPWQGVALVYLFQRPESMARAWDKARAELAPGSWLVSLAFEVQGQPPTLSLPLDGGRVLHAWRIPGPTARGSARRQRAGSTRAHRRR
ncbi:MAG: class I SAM-dependent methyltransferase [Rhodoferax sp.]|nr:class I SAM-dependent methyltransferase [Rhodoferax sp.]MCP5288589.1 class I SAM-dependent methyltransferase [Burkholderiaceae bacterium]